MKINRTSTQTESYTYTENVTTYRYNMENVTTEDYQLIGSHFMWKLILFDINPKISIDF